MKVNSEKLYVSPREYAKMIGRSESTVRRWINNKVIEYEQPCGAGTAILIPIDATEKYRRKVVSL
jgi:excisionase family DNA binding protein